MKFNNKTLIAAGLLLTCVAASPNLSASTLNKPHLSPLWYLFWQQLHAAFRGDPCVNVEGLSKEEDRFLVEMHVVCKLPEKAVGLSALFSGAHDMGELPLYVNVYDFDGHQVPPKPLPKDYAALAKLISNSLSGNPFYAGVRAGNPYFDIFIVFSQAPVQYFADDWSKPDLVRTMVAADAFQQLMFQCESDECPAIGVSTVLTPPPPAK